MNLQIYKRLTIALSVVCLGLLVLSGHLFWKFGLLSIQVAFASAQTKIFGEMRKLAFHSSPEQAVSYMNYAINYYPSGTKQESGSKLDVIVERERRTVVRDIIAYLRTKTGEDLGDDPDLWVQKYGK